MSKTNKTTKVAMFIRVFADCGDELVPFGHDFNGAHALSEGHLLAETSKGIVAWSNGFSSALPGDKVILRKGASRSHGDMQWVMTGHA